MNFIILGCIMLKRKAVTSIKNWINTKNKKCLVVQGARQTGKTYIIERFAEDNYEELLEINFKQMASAADIFPVILRWIIWLWQCVSDFLKRKFCQEKL